MQRTARQLTGIAVGAILLLPWPGWPAAAPGGHPGKQVSSTLAEARAALEGRSARRAVQLLRPLVAEHPEVLTAWQLLGAAQQTLGDTYAALEAYGAALALDAGDGYSTRAVRGLCRDGLPLKLPAAQRSALFGVLGEAPLRVVDLTLDTSAVCPPSPAQTLRRAFHTTGVLFAPRDEQRDPVHRSSPETGFPDWLRFNRLCYGYVLEDERRAWRQRFRIHYVSEFLAGQDYSGLAEDMCGLFLRLYWLGKDAINVETRFANDGVIDVWLMKGGQPGAEQRPAYTEDLFFYGIDTPRPGIEWIREVAHEYGHQVIPPVDGYSNVVEPWATGIIGERLFLPWLATLGFGLKSAQGPFAATSADYDRYYRTNVLADVNFFLDRGPSETLGADRTKPGWRYLHGFLSYVNGQYGSGVLTATFKAGRKLAPGEYMTGIDLVRAFQQVQRAPRAFTMAPRLPIPSLSTSASMDGQGCMGGRAVTVHQGDRLAWWVYLPAGVWEVNVVPSAPTTATLGIGLGREGEYDRSLVLTPNGNQAQWVSLGTLAAGWHVLRMRGVNVPSALPLKAIRWKPGRNS